MAGLEPEAFSVHVDPVVQRRKHTKYYNQLFKEGSTWLACPTETERPPVQTRLQNYAVSLRLHLTRSSWLGSWWGLPAMD